MEEKFTYNKDTIDLWKEKLRSEPKAIDEEIKETEGTISNELLWLKGAPSAQAEEDHMQNIANLTEYKNWLEDLKKGIEDLDETFDGFGNGHSEYVVGGVDKDKFLTWAAIVAENEPLAEVKFKTGNNGATVVEFTTCERYPGLVGEITYAFSGAVVYGMGMWDTPEFVLSDGCEYTADLEECFEDEGNLRIDVKLTDKKYGCTAVTGELIVFDTLEEVEDREDYGAYEHFVGFLKGNSEALSKVDAAIEECRAYHRK